MEEKNSYDAIIIGSGIGGLAAASVLAQVKRYRVLVLEQHFKLGGYTHTFQRPGGYTWDIGLHYVGEMGLGNPLRRTMDFIMGGKVEWARMKDPFEVFVYPGLNFEVPSGEKNYLQKLTGLFPAEGRPLRRYFRDLNRIVEFFSGRALSFPGNPRQKRVIEKYRERSQQSLRDYLDGYFRDKKLKAILASQWGDYGLPPHLASFRVHAVTTQHYLEGGYYPVGSASVLAEASGQVVRAAGGDLKVRHRVERILLEEGRAVGVEVRNNQGLQTVRAAEIYSDIGAEATYGKLLRGEGLKEEESRALSQTETYGAVLLFIGLKSHCGHLGVHGQNFWMYDDFDHDAVWGRRNLLAEGRASSCYLSFPGLKDPAAKKPTAEIMAPLDYGLLRDWRDTRWKKRGNRYEDLKNKITEALLSFVEERLPGFRSEIVTTELATPLSFESFMGHREGSIYGFPGLASRYGLKCIGPKTPWKGLSLVGADAGTHGITGAMMGGIWGVVAQHGYGILAPIFKAP
ncbi:MAG TPA: NAD(P)/FAD-dependent oxidoreductase [bacterium]|jgi:all-trans-retinol 13,14-reductase|nr:NAD(P)/FAD-dependent oxidoreductase [bacterium]